MTDFFDLPPEADVFRSKPDKYHAALARERLGQIKPPDEFIMGGGVAGVQVRVELLGHLARHCRVLFAVAPHGQQEAV